jgi:hypothetical protein
MDFNPLNDALIEPWVIAFFQQEKESHFKNLYISKQLTLYRFAQ